MPRMVQSTRLPRYPGDVLFIELCEVTTDCKMWGNELSEVVLRGSEFLVITALYPNGTWGKE